MGDKLAIIGSCVSEDWIHFRDFASEFRFDLPPMRQHSSLLSVVSKPLDLPDGLFGQMSAWEEAQIRSDFDKSFLQRLAEASPRVLIVDLAIDAMVGVIPFGGSYVTKSYMLRKSPLFAELKARGILTPQVNQQPYLDEFAAAVKLLQRFMKHRLPQCQVILHKTRYATSVIDKAGIVRKLGEQSMAVFGPANQQLPVLEELFQQHLPCDVIALTDETWHGDERHMWGMGGMHLERGYYERFNIELAKILARGVQSES
jgi:hypothetical protein